MSVHVRDVRMPIQIVIYPDARSHELAELFDSRRSVSIARTRDGDPAWLEDLQSLQDAGAGPVLLRRVDS